MYNKKILYLVFTLATAALIYFPVFLHLDWWTYRAYDEAITGLNSYSIYQSGDYLIPTNEGQPELWNCKPPLLMWCQVFFMKLIGVSEISIRLPTSLSVVALCLFLLLSLYRLTQSIMPGWIAIMVLVTTPGFITNHVARTGDFDGLLCLFTTLYCLLFYFYVEESYSKRKTILLLLFFLCLCAATFTKSIAALLFLPVIFVYVLVRKKISLFLTSKAFWLLGFSYILLVVGYYFYRDYRVPGFLQAMLDNEVFSRYNGGAVSQTGAWYYYITKCYETSFDYWIWSLPIPLFAAIQSKFRVFYLYVFSLVVFHHFIIAKSVSKLDWYMAPEYPLLAILIGMGLFDIWNWAKPVGISLPKTIGITAVLAIALFAYPYNKVIHSVYFPSDHHSYPNEYPNFGKFLRNKILSSKGSTFYVLCGYKYAPDIRLQVLSLQSRGYHVHLFKYDQRDYSNKLIIAESGEFHSQIEPYYNYRIIDSDNFSAYCHVYEKKN